MYANEFIGDKPEVERFYPLGKDHRKLIFTPKK